MSDITIRMTAKCPVLHDLLSTHHGSYGECIHKQLGDRPEVKWGEHGLSCQSSALITSWITKFLLKSIYIPMPLTLCASAFTAVWWLSEAIFYASLMTDLNQKETTFLVTHYFSLSVEIWLLLRHKLKHCKGEVFFNLIYFLALRLRQVSILFSCLALNMPVSDEAFSKSLPIRTKAGYNQTEEMERY